MRNKTMIKKVTALAMSAIMAASMTACSGNGAASSNSGGSSAAGSSAAQTTQSSGDSQDPIKVAAFFNLSGANADTGLRDKEGTDLAIKYINDNGGIKSMGGRKLEVVYGDLLSDVSQSKAVTERVLADKGIAAAVGVGGSAYAAPQLPIMEKQKVPYILFGTAASLTEQGYQYLFRVSPYGGNTGAFGHVQVQFLQWLNTEKALGTTKVGIVYENSDFGISLADSNRSMVEEAGLEVVYEESYPIGLTDASSLVVNLKNSGAEAVFVASFPQEGKLIFNAMKSINYSPVIIGGGGGFLFPEFGKALGDDVQGLVSVASLNYDTQTMQNGAYKDVPQLYEETYGTFMCEHAVCAYANIIILADALERAGSTDGEALQKALKETDLATPQCSGNVSFDEVGNNKNAVPVIIQWQKREDGIYAPVTVYPEAEANGEYQSIGQ